MNLFEFEHALNARHSDWTVAKSQSGEAVWLDVVKPNGLKCTIQVTPMDGIGVSRRSESDLDFDGHEEVFTELIDVMGFLESL